MTTNQGSDRLLSQSEAAEFLGAAKRTLESWRAQRKGPPFIAISRRCVRYRLADISAWLERHVVATDNGSSASGEVA